MCDLESQQYPYVLKHSLTRDFQSIGNRQFINRRPSVVVFQGLSKVRTGLSHRVYLLQLLLFLSRVPLFATNSLNGCSLPLMLELDVSPGQQLGPFSLGSPLGSVIEWLIANERVVPRVELVYSAQVEHDVVLDLVDQCMVLRFSGRQQVLTMVHVYDLSAVRIRYGATLFSQGSPTFSSLYSVFGPSYPGEFNAESSTYWLSYPGLTMTFRCSRVLDGVPVPLADSSGVGHPPTANDLYVFSGKTLSTRETRLSLDRTRSRLGYAHYFERVVAKPQHGVRFAERGFEVCFGDGAQSVLAVLGEPEGEYEKTDDKLKIHASPDGSKTEDDPLPYFWNYFSLGLDVLFDGNTHTVSKIKLHSNWPGHREFHHYSRCNWEIASTDISYLTRWAEASETMQIAEDSAPLVSVGTVFHGIDDGVIIEVMKSDLIASVILF